MTITRLKNFLIAHKDLIGENEDLFDSALAQRIVIESKNILFEFIYLYR